MVVTNKFNLPQAMVDAVSTERHNKSGCYSATTLLKGVKQIVLELRHWDEIEIDVVEQIWAIFGTAVHSVFENADKSGQAEQSYECKVCDSTVSGKVDLYDKETCTICDYKTASVYKVVFSDFEDWQKQGLIYAWLLSKCGETPKKARFIALLKDHSKMKARKGGDYPKLPCSVYEFDITQKGLEEIEQFITDKVQAIEKALTLSDDEIEPCSEKERWASESKWAVMKVGRKTAIKLFDSEQNAKDYMAENDGSKYYIEERKAENKRCIEYCPVKEFCSFYKGECDV